MSGGSGVSSRKLLAGWNHGQGCSCSKTSLGCSLSTGEPAWPASSTRWQRSAMWDATGFSELPTLVPATKESGGSSSPSLLPTCSGFSQNGGDPHLTPGLAEHWRTHRGNLVEWAAATLLPTPLARDHKGNNTPTGSPHHSRPGQVRGPGEAGLPQTLMRLLPTPRVQSG